jgi:hypothetical protein
MIVFRLARLLPTPESVGERRVVIALPLLENPDVRAFCTQGIVGVGAAIPISIASCSTARATRSTFSRAEEEKLRPQEATILVVEDEDVLRLAASKMLRRIGLSVIEASDGSAALDLIRAHKERINAVLLDITLPGASSRTSEMNHNQRWLLADGLIGLAMLFGALLLLLTFSSARLP